MWKQVFDEKYGYLNYEVNEEGDVRNINTKKLCKKHFDGPDGYIFHEIVVDTRTGKTKFIRVHRIVAQTFKPIHFKDQTVVNHIDGNKQNNHIDNLEWVTPRYNIIHAVKLGLRQDTYHKYDDDTIRKVCEDLSKGKSSLRQIAFFHKVDPNVVFQIYKRTVTLHNDEEGGICVEFCEKGGYKAVRSFGHAIPKEVRVLTDTASSILGKWNSIPGTRHEYGKPVDEM